MPGRILRAVIILSVALMPAAAHAATDPSAADWEYHLAEMHAQTDAQPISAFAGVVRLPRREFALFDGPALMQAQVARDSLTARVMYTVALGSATGSGAITLSGVVGRRPELDGDAPQDCLQPGPNYCADTGYVSGPPTGETFFHLHSQAGHPGRVVHGMCCNGENWSVQWYVPDDDTTHTMQLYLEPAERIGQFDRVPATDDNIRRLGVGNLAIAQWLLDLTDTFIGFRKGTAVEIPARPNDDPTLSRVARARIDAANQTWMTLVGPDAAGYDIDSFAAPSYGGAAMVDLTIALPEMRRNGLYRDAHLLSTELTDARRLADGTIEASTREIWDDHSVDVATGETVSDYSGEVQQAYSLGLVDGAWKVLEIRVPRSSLN